MLRRLISILPLPWVGVAPPAEVTDPTARPVRISDRIPHGVPAGKGTFRTSAIDAIAALDADIVIFSEAHPDAWKSVREVRALAAPFGWVEEPPSITRLPGLACLSGYEPARCPAAAVRYNPERTDPCVYYAFWRPCCC